MEGSCHVLAVALHRMHGWAIHLVIDEGTPHWEDPADADNYIPVVLHAYAMDPEGNAWDAMGVRPASEIQGEIKDWLCIDASGSDQLHSEGELRSYVGFWSDDGEEPVDRPLSDYDESKVDEASAFARSALGHLPGFPGCSSLARGCQ